MTLPVQAAVFDAGRPGNYLQARNSMERRSIAQASQKKINVSTRRPCSSCSRLRQYHIGGTCRLERASLHSAGQEMRDATSAACNYGSLHARQVSAG